MKKDCLRKCALSLMSLLLLTGVSTQAALLQWNPNPAGESISYYTVYAESLEGTNVTRVYGETSYDLSGLLEEVLYTISITATSTEGLESERSQPITYAISWALPQITKVPVSTNIAAGSTLNLAASASSVLPLKHQWLKNGQPLVGQTNATLTISSAALSDAGNYSVNIENSNGTVTSSEASVLVQVAPRIYTHPQAFTAAVGSVVLLSVGAGGSTLNYQWFKNGAPIPGATKFSLTLSGVQKTHEGSYHVVVSNLVGREVSSPAMLTVSSDPAAAGNRVTIARGPNGLFTIQVNSAPNTVLDLQMADSLGSSNWRLLQTITTDATGAFQTSLLTANTRIGFIRAVKR